MSEVTTVDLAEWPEFEKEALKLYADIPTMLDLMRKVMSDDSFSDALKEQKMGKLVTQYLPA